MDYVCTRNDSEVVTAAQAIARGISPDGGLYVPAEFPTYEEKDLLALKDMSYPQRAAYIMKDFLTDFTQEEINAIIETFERESYLQNTTFISFKLDNLDKVRAARPQQSCQYLIGTGVFAPDWAETLAEKLAARLGCDRGEKRSAARIVVEREAVVMGELHGGIIPNSGPTEGTLFRTVPAI